MNADNTARNTDENLALTDVAEFCRGVGLDTSGGTTRVTLVEEKVEPRKNLKRKRANHIEEETNGEEIDWEKARADKLPDEEDEDARKLFRLVTPLMLKWKTVEESWNNNNNNTKKSLKPPIRFEET